MVSLSSFTYVHAAEDGERRLLLGSRSDLDDETSVRSLNFDSKNLNDEQWKTVEQTYNVGVISAQNNLLLQPQPLRLLCLTEVNLSHGTITVLSVGDWVRAMPELEKLNCAYNNISSIVSDRDPDVSCYYCDGFNPFYSGNKVPWRSDSLKTLNLRANKLTEFDLNIINNAPNLLEADFSENNISTVILPGKLNPHVTCTINLESNCLDNAATAKLEKCNMLDSEKYEKRRRCGVSWGPWIGMVPMTLIDVPIITAISNTGADIFNFGGFVVFFTAVAAQAALSAWLTGKVCGCTVPDDQRTYKPFTFMFTSQKNDPVVVSMNSYN